MGLSASAAYSSVAETTGLKAKDVKAVVEGLMGIAAEELKKAGSFKLAGMLNMKLKKKPATPARKGVNPFTKEPCVFKAKPASKTVRALPMKKLKEMINERLFEYVKMRTNMHSKIFRVSFRPRWADSPGLLRGHCTEVSPDRGFFTSE